MKISRDVTQALFFGLAVLVAPQGQAQGIPEDGLSRMIITVSDYRTNVVAPTDASPNETISFLKKAESKSQKTFRIPTLNETEASFNTSETVYVAPLASRKDGNSDNHPVKLQIGTTLQVRAKRVSAGALMELSYTTSLHPDKAGSPTAVKTTTILNTDFYDLGVPRILYGLGSAENIYLIVTVTEPSAETKLRE
jgi:hypothetical protein